MIQVAIIGAGLAGLATAYALCMHRSSSISVRLFEEKKIGGGASGVCSGLLHPYPGLSAHRSPRSSEGLQSTKALLAFASSYVKKPLYQEKPILRRAITQEQKMRLESHASVFQDIKALSDSLFSIESGMTVDMEGYLAALSEMLFAQGVKKIDRHIIDVEELFDFDKIVVAAGWGIRHLYPTLLPSLQFLKGQALRLQGPSPFGSSYISKGYIADLGGTSCELGSTYEREFVDDRVDLELAKKLLEDKVEGVCKKRAILECRAGVRVACRNSVLPLIAPSLVHREKVWIFTGLGSRGLLYHALYANELVSQMYPDIVE